MHNTASPYLIPDPHSLGHLEDLCFCFNALCDVAFQCAPPDEGSLIALDDQLWSLTLRTCAEVDRLTAVGDLGPQLEEFRQRRFVEAVLKWYRLNPTIDRLWTKPAGYSGDCRTIAFLCKGIFCWSRFEDIFANHLLRCRMTDQHRNKVLEQAAFMRDKMAAVTRRAAEMLVIGCGPSVDVGIALTHLPENQRAKVTLADLDPDALRASREELADVPPGVSLSFAQGDVLRLLRKLDRNGQTKFDAIVFGGLFDYLDDRRSALVLRVAWGLLSDTGEIMFSQVARGNPDRAFMNWYGAWELLERNEDDLLRLCTAAGIPAQAIRMRRTGSELAIICRICR